MTSLRCYTFSNMYLSSIQIGIQSAHSQMEMLSKYRLDPSSVADVAFDWAANHKTMICLNGGMNDSLEKLVNILSSDTNPFPWAPFYESVSAMDGMLTNVCLVLPDYIYETAAGLRGSNRLHNVANFFIHHNDSTGPHLDREFSSTEVDIMNVLQSCGLAR